MLFAHQLMRMCGTRKYSIFGQMAALELWVLLDF
jgi:hypothetical protein